MSRPSFSVTTLGTGTALPDALRGPTSTLVRFGDVSVLVDLGSGTLQKLHAAGGDLLTLDAVVVTHAHLDHFADMLPLLFALFVPGYEREEPLRVILSEETLSYVRGVQGVFGRWLEPAASQIQFETVSGGESLAVGELNLTAFAVQHDESSLGFRFEAPDGRVLVIPGDSGPCESLTAGSQGADLLVLECSLPDSIPLESHLTPSSVAQVASDADVGTLVVVHRYPEALAIDVRAEIQAGFTGTIVVANDGDELEVA